MNSLNEINRLAIWKPIGTSGFSIRPYGDGYAYLDKKIVKRSSLGNPVTRYAKNYKKGKKEFSLGFFTNEADSEKAEKWLDEQAKKIDAKDINGKFNLLDILYPQ